MNEPIAISAAQDGLLERSMIKQIPCLLALFCCMCLSVPAIAETDISYDLGVRAATVGMDLLKFDAGSPDVLALTNAGHATIKGGTTERALTGLTETSGLNNGDNNLFQVNRPNWKPLWFFFYNKKTGMAAYMEPDAEFLLLSPDEQAALPADKAFSQVSLMVADLDKMLASPNDGNITFSKKKFGGNEFSLIGLSNVWAAGATYDFMNAAAFHDHLCPGVTSGYMLIKYVEKVLPITNKTAEIYVDIGSPNWCKEDAYQMIWDSTPGKNSMFVMALSPEDEAALTKKYGIRPAGIIIRWNDVAKKGRGIALGFNFDLLSEEIGVANWTGPSWAPKLVQDIGMIPYVDKPEYAIKTLKEFDLDEANLTRLKTAGNNPYKILGML
jgi:formylmethanofuran dehydrogenase subunit E-like metal-binding protein